MAAHLELLLSLHARHLDAARAALKAAILWRHSSVQPLGAALQLDGELAIDAVPVRHPRHNTICRHLFCRCTTRRPLRSSSTSAAASRQNPPASSVVQLAPLISSCAAAERQRRRRCRAGAAASRQNPPPSARRPGCAPTAAVPQRRSAGAAQGRPPPATPILKLFSTALSRTHGRFR